MMLSFLHNRQLALIKATITQKVVDQAIASKVKTTANRVTDTLVKLAMVTDPTLAPVLQAGIDQLKALCQLIRSGSRNN